ncbi:hypothetical protein [Proteiniborus sp. MB09-C3]|uniref:hypothetical protein n=1 Tax=Proteiniborus sp. MB09-C3 TaxID=3050072 RepID=UPI0025568915|nr:hypothetical protein [Proteiniborus sp. MB09-C3]WIV12526.1 hypothetical protein QO263_02030 [Proteiniborus sp. MB09-C3]
MDKDFFQAFLIRFRVNCNLRAGFLPANYNDMEFPFRIYKGAYEETREELIKEENPTEEQLKIIANAYEVFMKHLEESEDYGFAEKEMINWAESIKSLNKGRDSQR